MELTPVTYLIVLPLVFLAGFVDSVAGGGGMLSWPLVRACTGSLRGVPRW